MRAKFVFEVLRSEDEWADREIDRYQGKDVKEPEKKEFKWTDIIPDDDVDPDDPGRKRIDPITGIDMSPATPEELEKEELISHINSLEEYIWENANPKQQSEWNDFIRTVDLNNLNIAELEIVYMKASIIVNSLKP